MIRNNRAKEGFHPDPPARRPGDLSPWLLGHLIMNAKEKQLDTLFLSFRFAAQRVTNKKENRQGDSANTARPFRP